MSASKKLDPMELAGQFLNLDHEDFRMFWAFVSLEWDQDDGDIEAQWFHCGKHMRPTGAAVISAMHGAVRSGINEAMKKRKPLHGEEHDA